MQESNDTALCAEDSPEFAELGSLLALDYAQYLGGDFTVYTTLDIEQPETIHNFKKFGVLLARAYQEGVKAEQQSPRARTAPSSLTDEELGEMYGKATSELDFGRKIERRLTDAVIEQCAEICDDLHHEWRWDNESDSDSGPRNCARAIRALSGAAPARKEGT